MTTQPASGGRHRQGEPPIRREPSTDRLMTLDEVADYLSVPKNSVYKWISMGTFCAYYKVGKYRRVKFSDLEKWLAERQDDVSRGV